MIRGVVMLHNDLFKIDVITMNAAPGFDAKEGGQITLRYLHSIASPSDYGTLRIEFERAGSTWTAYALEGASQERGAAITQVHFVGNYSRILSRYIGITDAQTR